jgi:predicted transcriptional regulator
MKANLSSHEINRYISLLLKHRLLEYDNVLRIYQITNTGERILYMYERLMNEVE